MNLDVSLIILTFEVSHTSVQVCLHRLGMSLSMCLHCVYTVYTVFEVHTVMCLHCVGASPLIPKCLYSDTCCVPKFPGCTDLSGLPDFASFSSDFEIPVMPPGVSLLTGCHLNSLGVSYLDQDVFLVSPGWRMWSRMSHYCHCVSPPTWELPPSPQESP